MRIVFVSNYFSHHQKPVSDALAALTDYCFLATAPMDAERRAMGWGGDGEPDYVCHWDAQPDRAEALLRQADVVIAGSAPEKLLRSCIRRGQLVLRYAERPLKKGSQWHKYLPRLIKWHVQNPLGKPIYMLCASAYTAGDYARFGLFRGRAFRWGYFPETARYADPAGLMERKRENTILWAGRFLDWKHPEDALRVAAALRAEGLEFTMELIGMGEREPLLRQWIIQWELQDCVRLLGTMPPAQVRRHMERSRIFLFTSDRREGWGAVLNEAMNSGCAVVASDAIGSVPCLIRDRENGRVYASGDIQALTDRVRELLCDPARAERLGLAAMETVTGLWNAETAAARLVELIDTLRCGGDGSVLYADGPCSRAPILRDGWFLQGSAGTRGRSRSGKNEKNIRGNLL